MVKLSSMSTGGGGGLLSSQGTNLSSGILGLDLDDVNTVSSGKRDDDLAWNIASLMGNDKGAC
eukprot:07502.XXX_59709_59897_1 [CDS] Oithona nana genome sequencing.